MTVGPTVTTRQAAVILGTTTSNVRKLANRGHLRRVGLRDRNATYLADEVLDLAARRNGTNADESMHGSV